MEKLAPHFIQSLFVRFFSASRSPSSDPLSAIEMTRLALLKMYNHGGAPGSPPVSLPNLPNLPNLPHLPGLPADILAQAQQHQDKALNLHIERQKALEAATADSLKDSDR